MSKNKEIKIKNIDIKELEGSEIEINCVIDKEYLAEYRVEAVRDLQKHAELPGFRKGQVPEKIIAQKIGEFGILQETAEIIISNVYSKIIIENKLDPIGKPEIKIKKLALENDFEFTITSSVYPKVELPDYKKIAVKILEKPLKDLEIAEKEVDEALMHIRNMHAGLEADGKTPKVPELNEEFLKKLGNFATVEDLKNRVKEGLKKDKADTEREKLRLEILEEINKESKAKIPKLMIDSELNRMVGQMESDVQNSGMKMEDYLKSINKTLEDLKNEWKDSAEKRAKTQVLVNEIARKENLRPEDKEVHDLAHYLLEQYKDADHDATHIYAEMILTNKKVLEFLDGLKSENSKEDKVEKTDEPKKEKKATKKSAK